MEEEDNVKKENVVSEAIFSIIEHLNIPLDGAFELEKFEEQLNVSFQRFPKDGPKILFNFTSFNATEWEQLDKYAHFLNEDYSKRTQLLKKRLEATIDSFLWSERVKKLEPKIKEICDLSSFKNAQFEKIGINQLLSADSDLLFVNKTSSDKFRQNTKVKRVTDFKVRQIAFDRGGRTEQMVPMMKESFEEQKFQRMQQRGGGGFHGGGGKGRSDGDGGNYHYQQRYEEGGRRGRGYRGGHGNQRGNKRGRYN